MVLLVYLGTDLLAAWGLNLEFGVAGVVNFAYIVLVAAGAYFYAAFTLGPPAASGGFQEYIIGGATAGGAGRGAHGADLRGSRLRDRDHRAEAAAG